MSFVTWAYHLGNPSLNYNIRLGIVYVPLLLVLAGAFLSRVLGKGVSPRLMVLGCAFLLLFQWPVASLNVAVCEITEFRSHSQIAEYLERYYPDKDVLLISYDPVQWSVLGYSSVSFKSANKNLDVMALEMQKGKYRDVLVIQQVDKATGRPLLQSDIAPDAPLELITEMSFQEHKVLLSKFDKAKLAQLSSPKTAASLPAPQAMGQPAPQAMPYSMGMPVDPMSLHPSMGAQGSPVLLGPPSGAGPLGQGQ